MHVLFVCVGNQGRSVMAERLFRAATTEHEAKSAGAAPGAAIHPEIVDTLAELGIDATDHVPQKLNDDLLAWADVVVATCDHVCPATPGKRRFDWKVRDPMGEPPEEVRAIRNEIHEHVGSLLSQI